MKKRYFFLFLIFLLAAFLRFYKLGVIPNGLYQDETAIGYNAYSILQTGRDEHGLKFPLYFKSFGDYKLPVYIYLTALSVKLFGLTEWAVRFPSALFGTLTIPLLFFLLQKLFKSYLLSLIASLLLAINPWHLHYSRASFEVTLALFFFLLGTLLLERKTLFGTLCFIVAFYSYNLTRLLAPLLYVLSIWYFKVRPKPYIFVVSLILLLPFFATLFTSGGTASAKGTIIFTSRAVHAPVLEFRSYMLSVPFSKVFFNQLVSTFWLYMQNIMRFLSVEFFFISGSNVGNHGIGNVGQFYLFELPLILLGFKKNVLLIGWALITILVASLTREAPHATRSFFLIFPLVVFSSFGIVRLVKMKRIFLFLASLFIIYNLVYYFSSYYLRFPLYFAKQWRAADKDVALFLKHVEDDYNRIIIDRHVGFMYTSILFYQKIPPSNFQETAKRLPDDSEGFSYVSSFGKYEFRDIDWTKDTQVPKTLFITSRENKPKNIAQIREFFYPNRPVVISIKEQITQYPFSENAYVAVASN